MTTTVLCCLLLLRGVSANGGIVTSKADQRSSSRSSELWECYNCEPKKGKRAQPHFMIIVSLYKKKAASHTLTHAHIQIHSVMRKHSHMNAYTHTCTHARTSLNLSDTRACDRAHSRSKYTNEHKRGAQTQSECPHKVDELHSVSNWKHLQSQFLSAVEACISRQKRLLGVPEWLA